MDTSEIKSNEAIEEGSDNLRDFESALTSDLSELKQDVTAFQSGKRPFWIVDQINRLGRWANRYPRVKEKALDTIIDQARELITMQPPSDRLIKQDVRDLIKTEVDLLRGDKMPDGAVCPLDAKLQPTSLKIISDEWEKIKRKQDGKALPTDKETNFDKLTDKIYIEEKKPVLNSLVAELKPKTKELLDTRFEALKKKTNAKLKRKALPSDKVAEFYVLYAIFTEYFKSMKLLYQVLLKEYEELELLSDNASRDIRHEAIQLISKHLAQGRWKGIQAAGNRAEFRNTMLEKIRKAVHARDEGEYPEPPISALCLSGGGIRSATFSLGVIQALAKHSLLAKFDYLSTVSGGGYIGGWLSAWIQRSDKSVEEIERVLVERKTGEVEPPQVTHLRSYSNYMSPRIGISSADTWTLIGVYLRNLLLNWTVVIPIGAGILLLPRILVEVVAHGDDWVGPAPSIPAFILYAVAVFFGVVAAFSTTIFRPSISKLVHKRGWFSQLYRRDDIGMLRSAEPKVVWLCVVPMIIFGIGATTYWSWGTKGERLRSLERVAGYISEYGLAYWIFGAITVLFIGIWIFNLIHRRNEKANKIWDDLFVSLLFLACIGFAALLSYSLTRNVLMFGIVGFALLVFIVGFVLARTFIYFSTGRTDRSLALDNIGYEFCISFLAASLGGLFLFASHKGVIALGERIQDVDFEAAVYTTLALPTLLIIYLLSGTIFVGIGSKLLDDGDREWLSRVGAWLLLLAVAWLAVFSLVLLVPYAVRALSVEGFWPNSLIASFGGISGVITLLFGFFARGTSEKKPPLQKKKGFISEMLPKIAAPMFGASLVVLLVIATDALMTFVGSRFVILNVHDKHSDGTSVLALLIWASGFAAFGSFMGLWVNINKFSLHAMYRDRIVRAYLGASRGFERLTSANSFTGLDEKDNVDMKDLENQRPFHVVNMTLNLASSANLRWQNRKAESFTATPFHCGSSNMGEGSGNYRASKLYGADKFGRPITLGTAIAISGAAASPNMGYFTQSAPVSALMALFNVRLGWWLGNPGGRGRKTYRKNAPDFAPIPMANEALGRTGDTNSYVYLSDGGHFENLGLYEMVLRRCKLIVLCDGGADPGYSYSDLATAIHKIRVDMGVPIEFDDGMVPKAGQYCTIGNIRYSAIDGDSVMDGQLIYLKPTLNKKEPIDIANYKKNAPNFPHETTADQMYSETQFESYRLLGFHMMNTICGPAHKVPCTLCGDLGVLQDRVSDYLTTVPGKNIGEN